MQIRGKLIKMHSDGFLFLFSHHYIQFGHHVEDLLQKKIILDLKQFLFLPIKICIKE